MNILLITKEGELLPLAKRIQDEGHPTTLHINDREKSVRGRGIVEHRSATLGVVKQGKWVVHENVDNLLKLYSPELVILDGEMGDVGDYLREKGVKVWGTSRWSDTINGDERYGNGLMKTANIDCPVGVSVRAWWDGVTFSRHVLLVRDVGMMDDGAGIKVVGGCIVKSIKRKCRISRQTINKLSSLLKHTAFSGPIEVGKRMRAGFSLSEFAASDELANQSVLKQILGETRLKEGVGVATHITIPPYPQGDTHKPILVKVNSKADRHVWLVDITNSHTSGLDGNLGWVSARGTKEGEYGEVREARRRARRTIDNLRNTTSSLQFRTDIGKVGAKLFSKIERERWLN